MSLVFLLSFAVARAEVLTADQVTKSVLANFPLIAEAESKNVATREKLAATRGAFDTKLKLKTANRTDSHHDYAHIETSLEKTLAFQGLTVFAGHRQGLGDIPGYTGKYETSSAGEIFAGLSLPILRGRGINEARTDRAVAELEADLTAVEVRLKRNASVYKALSTFQKWKLVHRKERIYSALLKIAEDRQTMLEKRVHAGDLERLKLTDNQRSINKRRDEWLGVRQDLEGLNAVLGLFVRAADGEPRDARDFTPDDAAPRPSDLHFGGDIDQNPQVMVIDRRLEQLHREEALGKNLMLPMLNVEASTTRDLDPDGYYDKQRVQVGVVFEYPLENHKGTGKRNAARASVVAAEQQRRYLRNELSNTLRRAEVQIHIATERSKVLARELDNARVLAEAERRRWAHGDSDLYIVTLREQDVADAEAKLWTAYYEFEQLQLDARLALASLAP
jgi:hypothetical protein